MSVKEGREPRPRASCLPHETLVPNHCVVYLPLPSTWISSAAEEAQKQRRKPEKEPDENGRSLPGWWYLENSEQEG